MRIKCSRSLGRVMVQGVRIKYSRGPGSIWI